MKKLLIFSLLALFVFSSCEYLFDRHLIKSKEQREYIHQRFQKRIELVKRYDSTLSATLSKELSAKEREGLEFLYAYMPLSDLAMHNSRYVLKQVKTALQARKQFKWARRVPSDIFLHFVLPYRVNNEYTDTARQVFFTELSKRVKGMDARNAALEVNYWCREKVTYRSTNARTCGPLTALRSAFGRCGEESTFAVAAYRSIGIPARQVYTPRWAHTDDNHAWVEIYVDGKWHFLGACEPEPELDRGWFAAPATRAMMARTFVYGQYSGNEHILSKTNWYSELNLLPNYAPVKTLSVTVTDKNGKPVSDADVEFQLYNYAEFYPIAKQKTTAKGNCSIITGYGDLLVWAERDECYGWVKADRNDTEITVTLGTVQPEAEVVKLRLTPPDEKPLKPLNSSAKKEHSKRIKQCDSRRKAFVATFIDSSQACSLAKEKGLPSREIWKILSASRGNWQELFRYIEQLHSDNITVGVALLKTLTEKDLRDITAATLLNHLNAADSFPAIVDNRHFDRFDRYVLSPRIGNELITPWRRLIQQGFAYDAIGYFRNNPLLLAQWINDSITIDRESNYYRVPIPPDAVFKLRIADPVSRDIFFVAACRSLGIPARLNPANKKPQFLLKNKWHTVRFDSNTEQQLPKGMVTVTLAPNQPVNAPKYYSHFTLAKFDKGHYHTLDFENSPEIRNFPFTLELDTGRYRLISGNRLNNGTVMCRMVSFDINKEKNTPITLEFYSENNDRKENYGSINDILLPDLNGNYRERLTGFTEKGAVVLAILNPDSEPGMHLLNDLADASETFDGWNGTIILLIKKGTKPEKFSPDASLKGKHLPKTTIWGYDKTGAIARALASATGKEMPLGNPAVTVINQEQTIIFLSEGYTIGLNNQLEAVLK